MKIVYRAANLIEADIVAGMLQSRGIEAEVGGRYLQSAVGDAAVHDFARVLVSEQQYDEALAVVAEYDSTSESSVSSDDKDESFAALGIFSKPVLFWLVLLLFMLWFVLGIPGFQSWVAM